MSNERIDIESMEARMRLWAIGDVSDEDLALELDYIVPELKRCYDLIDAQKKNLEFLNGAIEKLHEDTWFDAVTNLVEEHHPSEWCDYAVCWKCDEETASE